MTQTKKIALLGNPNSGKSSLFNQLTGLRQKVGNFPGVTVERKSGYAKLKEDTEVLIVDLPGTYSLYPTSADERIAVNALLDKGNKDYPDLIIYIADVTNLERHLLLLTQVVDLGFPLLVALNMNDVAEEQHLQCDAIKLSEELNLEVVKINGRTGAGLEVLKEKISQLLSQDQWERVSDFYTLIPQEQMIVEEVRHLLPTRNDYHALLLVHHLSWLGFLTEDEKQNIQNIRDKHAFHPINNQLDEIMNRYKKFSPILPRILNRSYTTAKTLTDKVDAVLTHKIIGPFIFFMLMFFVFQAIFSWSALPMDYIDESFAMLSVSLQRALPVNLFTRLLTEGLIPGISGILVFVPQITILFLLITLLEEVGYMSRAVFMFDSIMQKFGLNGRSIVSLISGGACAIPAIMSTRTISNWKERLTTIMVTPLISCSARIPVFAILIGFVMPSYKIGFFNAQGLVFMGLYLFGVVAALTAAFVFKKVLKTEEYSFLMLELPEYRQPHWKNVFYTVYDKVRSFVFGAGKIILIISLILWFLASFGPPKMMKMASDVATIESSLLHYDAQQTALYVASKKLEFSYAGYAGRFIEPVIKPLGFDWKIGIALITSFAAREVFVGTISTLYSIGRDADNLTIRQKLQQEKNNEGKPVFTSAVSLSLILFYLLAMQCMSTLATVYRETRSWKWPAIQFVYMTGAAYLVSLLVYQLLK